MTMTATHRRISYVLTVHNSEAVLERTVAALVDRLREFPGSEVVLVENGSHDGTPDLCRRLAAAAGSAAVRVVASESRQGMGFALREGLRVAVGDLLVLTSSELPFGFTDLEGWLQLQPAPMLVLGSKAHPESKVDAALLRKVLSVGFRVLRKLTLGIGTVDSQGSIFIEGDLGRRIRPLLVCEDYLIETEIVAWALRLGADLYEVPVTYPRSRNSTISPLRDSTRMAVGLFRLRRRLREADQPAVGRRGHRAALPPTKQRAGMLIAGIAAAAIGLGFARLRGRLARRGRHSRLGGPRRKV